VLSGSTGTWGDELMDDVDSVIFVITPTDVRMKRLGDRESMRHGERIKEGGDMHVESVKFLTWAEGYDDPVLDMSRSRERHEEWLSRLSVPVIRLFGDAEESVVMKNALIALGRDG